MASSEVLLIGLIVGVLAWALGALLHLLRLRRQLQAAFGPVAEAARGLIDQQVAEAARLRPAVPAESARLDAVAACGQQAHEALQAVREAPLDPARMARWIAADAALARAFGALALLRRAYPALAPADRDTQAAARRLAEARAAFNLHSARYNRAVLQPPEQAIAGLFGFPQALSLPEPAPQD